jgi:2-methylcitrate dehydratase PrpD
MVLSLTAAEFGATARAHVVDAVTDCIGCALAGSREPAALKLSRVLPVAREANETMTVPLIGQAGFAAPLDAALYNGTAAHALDYDDFSHPAYSHPSVVLVPALLGALPGAPASGLDFIVAYVAGLQVYGKLGRALNLSHSELGWHPTSTFGALAAAAAVGRLLGLSRDQLVTAFGIASSSASGLRGNFGTMTKPLHAGFAARNGLLAALLAREGFDAGADVVTGKYGFVRTFNAAGSVDEGALANWNAPLEIDTDFGLNLKPYPACAATHTAIEAVTMLLTAHGFAASDVESIRVGASKLAFIALLYDRPKTPLEAKFSMQYCVAAALLDGDVTLASFEPAQVSRPAIGALLPRVAMVDDPRVRDHAEMGSVVTVTLKNGAVLAQQVMIASGKPEKWFTPERLRTKFMDCAKRAVTPETAGRLYDALRALETNFDLPGILSRQA